ncbi:MAG: hypothetical protein AB7G23_20475 [Vicinamibacterales bacterium]
MRLLLNVRRGFDLTDEGMYLLSVDSGSDVASFHNPFGRYTRLLYVLAGSDVPRFRALGVLVLVAVAAVLGDRLAVLAHRLARRRIAGPVRLAAAGAMVGAALQYYLLYLITPSYNWLNLVGILAVLAGLAHELGRPGPTGRRSAVDQGFVGLLIVGVAAASAGKISSGPPLFLMAIGAVLVVVDPDRSARRHTLTSYGTWLVGALCAHWLLANPLPTTVSQLVRGQRSLVLLDPAYGLDRAVGSVGDAVAYMAEGLPSRLLLPGLACAVTSAGVWVAARHPAGKALRPPLGRALVALLPWMLAAATMLVAVQLRRRGDWRGSNAGYPLMGWVGLSYVALALTVAPVVWLRLGVGRVSRARLRVTVFVLAAGLGAFSYAFGSNNGFFTQLNGGIGPLVAAAVLVVLLVPDPSRLAIPVLAMAMTLGIGAWLVVRDAESRPYRQLALRQHTAAFELSDGRGTLLLPPALASTFEQMRTDAAANGWMAGTPLLDLSSYAAGVPFVLAADAPLTIIPSVAGYGGQQDLAADSIDQLVKAGWAPRWRNAWLLTLEKGPAPGVDPVVLGRLGRSFPQDYERIGTYRLAGRKETVELWRPQVP